jgi:hypothetical protein
VTGLHAARGAALLRRELQVEVEMVHAGYGQFKVVVDGETVSDGGKAAFLGVLPSGKSVVAAVKDRLEGTQGR